MLWIYAVKKSTTFDLAESFHFPATRQAPSVSRRTDQSLGHRRMIAEHWWSSAVVVVRSDSACDCAVDAEAVAASTNSFGVAAGDQRD